MTNKVNAYGAMSSTTPLEPLVIERRDVGEHDVQLDIKYSGVCHSDIHMTRDEWGFNSIYPMVPGHEIVGVVTQVGTNVHQFKIGDVVGVGVMVGSCQKCTPCTNGHEQYCEQDFICTYGAKDIYHNNEITHGGYSNSIVVDEKFVLYIPQPLLPKLNAVAPLLCAGITTWSPLNHWKVGGSHTVGVIGLGGLGHMAIKFARALGAHVVAITTSIDKIADAKKLGAHEVLLSNNPDEIKKYTTKFDFLLNTVPHSHNISQYVNLLKLDGVMVIVGALVPLDGLNGAELLSHRRVVTGSAIGGIKETREMLDFCAKHDILPDVELIKMEEINTAYTRMINGDVKYRFVIEMN